MKKTIYLIGLNLYSIFLALKIKSEFKNNEIIIIEGSKNFLNAYQDLKIKKFSMNPGFHALEDLRSKKLLKILSKYVKFNKIFKTRGLIIRDNLISYQDDYKRWPLTIKKEFNLKEKLFINSTKNDIIKFNKKYLKYLKKNFSDKKTSFHESVNLSYPWFFPPNYKTLSDDEAARFNQKVREKKLKHGYVFPKKGLFKNISIGLKKMLKKKNIKIKLNKQLKFFKEKKLIKFEGYKPLNNEKNIKIICIPVKPLSMSILETKIKTTKLSPIKYFTGLVEVNNFIKSDLDKFTEIIVSSELAFGLKRISLYSEIFNLKKRKIYQIEFLEHQNENNLERQLKNIIVLMSRFIEFNNNKKHENLKLLGYTFVRNTFRPKKRDMEILTNQTIKFFEKKKNIIFPRQITWPINSNKHFIFANNDYNKIIKKKLNLK